MPDMPMNPECLDFVPVDGDFTGYAHRSQLPDCSACVYFSRRNCGKDTGSDRSLFDQPLL